MNKYKITIKMIRQTEMIHSQSSMSKAKEDVAKILKNSDEKILKNMFKDKPKFIFTIERM